MRGPLVRRAVAVVVLTVSLLVGLLMAGALTAPAQAASSEQVVLAGLKRQFNAMSPAVKSATCKPYRELGDRWITVGVNAALASPTTQNALTRAQWTRVLRQYYRWACPGGTPR